ncbi:unnamed protein product [Heligmosomoides polygyrus]|uniref:PHB domain-containing protein n=1 Tax=Heligmosomoides polygyrus TaxID=6339 RepID=A0A3P8BND7_HELPZ|nr:unnamed protein product [Heligmosomoides polygyrus]
MLSEDNDMTPQAARPHTISGATRYSSKPCGVNPHTFIQPKPPLQRRPSEKSIAKLVSIVPVTQQTVFFALICMLVVLTFFTPSPVTIVTLSYYLLSINLAHFETMFGMCITSEWRFLPPVNVGVQPGAEIVVNSNLNSGIEQFTAPLVRFVTGGQPVTSDIEQLMHPELHTGPDSCGSRGGQFPLIPKETLHGIVQQNMLKMREAVAAAQSGRMVKDGEKVVVLIVFLRMCHGLIVLPVVFAALPFKEARVSQEKPHQLTIMDKKTGVGHQASHA